MKKLTILLLFAVKFARAQELVYDPQHTAAVIENGIARSTAETAHNQYLGKINKNLDDINTNVSSVVLAQTILYNALADVNSALKNGMAVKNIAVLTGNMIDYLQQCLDLAKNDPYLLLFATNIENEMQLRAFSLVSDVSGFILNSGSNVLADYNSRDQLLRKVTQQLQILDSLAYGAWRAMYWAKQRGIIAAVNPYAGWIRQDKTLVTQIIANTKYLTK